MRVGHETGLRFRHAVVGERLLRALINRVMHGAEERIRDVARIPAQRRAVRLDERRFFAERRKRFLFRGFEYEARGRRLADARRAIEQQVLRIRARELRHERLDGAFLPDNLAEVLRAQELHDGLCQMNLVHLLELLALLGVLRRFRRAFFLFEHLHPDVFDIVLMLLLKLVVDFLLDGVFDVLARHHVGDVLREVCKRLGNLFVRRRGAERRILEHDALEREHAVAASA